MSDPTYRRTTPENTSPGGVVSSYQLDLRGPAGVIDPGAILRFELWRRPGGSPSSLDKNVQSLPKREGWSKKQKRTYQRGMSYSGYWQAFGYAMLWVTLTSAPGSDPKRMAPDAAVLRKRIERKLGFKGVQHFQVKTFEGNGVYHMILAWKANGWRPSAFYINQGWLSDNWADIHGGSRIVWIARIGRKRSDSAKLSNYLVNQYSAGQELLDRQSGSWKKTFGGPIAATWQLMKMALSEREMLIRKWTLLMAGEVIVITRRHKQQTNLWKFTPPPQLSCSVEFVKNLGGDTQRNG